MLVKEKLQQAIKDFEQAEADLVKKLIEINNAISYVLVDPKLAPTAIAMRMRYLLETEIRLNKEIK